MARYNVPPGPQCPRLKDEPNKNVIQPFEVQLIATAKTIPLPYTSDSKRPISATRTGSTMIREPRTSLLEGQHSNGNDLLSTGSSLSDIYQYTESAGLSSGQNRQGNNNNGVLGDQSGQNRQPNLFGQPRDSFPRMQRQQVVQPASDNQYEANEMIGTRIEQVAGGESSQFRQHSDNNRWRLARQLF